jgi:hypothetical protein
VGEVTVSPEEFTVVFFDGARIRELAADVVAKVGLPEGTGVRIEVLEQEPLGRTSITALDPITISVEGGAFEDAKRPRHMSERSVVDVLGRLLFRAKDRLDPAFGDAPADADLDLQQHTAWETYCVGRCSRAGMTPSKPRRLYHFRNRHGFTDVSDAVFERLWNAEGLTWADLEAACAETAAAREPASA